MSTVTARDGSGTRIPPTAVHRVEVRPAPGRDDPRARALERDAAALGITVRGVTTGAVYLIEASLDDAQLTAVCGRLLADPVREVAARGAEVAAEKTAGVQVIEVHPLPGVMDPVAHSVRDAIRDLIGVEARVSTGRRYDLPGATAEQARAIADRLLANPVIQAVHAHPFWPRELPRGQTYELSVRHVPVRDLDDAALAKLSREAHLFLSLEEMRGIRSYYLRQEREPTDIELETLAQTWSEHCVHKTLKSRIEYRTTGAAAGEPADEIDWTGRPGHTVHADGSVTIDNLLRSTVAAATRELIADGVDWTLSVFEDNAGVIAFDDDAAVCVKVETHNHPSALEPYGGAATGVGGCIRDVIGTGLGAKPIANTDVFCVAYPGHWNAEGGGTNAEIAERNAENTEKKTNSAEEDAGCVDQNAEITSAQETTPESPFPSASSAFSSATSAFALPANSAFNLPSGCLHPRRILTQVVAGVRDYGNRMGIPTVSGAVSFDDRYIGNPLVFCGCVGVMPRDRVFGRAREGDRIIVLGGATGRDGIHGATFSSAELTDTHADEFSHAVQIGNAIEEKRTLDAILRAREYASRPAAPPAPLFHAITDCGAGGFSSAVGEMGEKIGAIVDLEQAPLKYAGLSYTEIWISEAQERMVLAVPPENVAALERICAEEHVPIADLGRFGTEGRQLILRYSGTEVGRLSMEFLHGGIPTPTRYAEWNAEESAEGAEVFTEIAEGMKGKADPRGASSESPYLSSTSAHPSAPSAFNPGKSLLAILAHPNVASKHWIIHQYDHEVQGNTAIKPLVGPGGRGPGDAAVLEPVPGTRMGLAVSCGLATGIGDARTSGDPYLMALAAIDECVRNLVCVGADPDRIAILDNFCWPSCEKPQNLGSLVRACEGCYDGAKAYRTPFVSGKDSLNNQFKADDGTTIEIPPTLLITGVGIVPELGRCVTSDAKAPGSELILVGATDSAAGGSVFALLNAGDGPRRGVPRTDPACGRKHARTVAALISRGLVRAAHDCSDGGLLATVAEMLIGGSAPDAPIGAELDLSGVHADPVVAAFAETPGRYVIEVGPDDLNTANAVLRDVPHARIGRTNESGRLSWRSGGLDLCVDDLANAWLRTLDW